MNKVLFVCLSLLAICVNAQNYQPLEIAQKIFSKAGLPNVDKHLDEGVSIGQNGVDLSGFKHLQFKLLAQYKSAAVINMTCTDTANNTEDVYIHFIKENTWRLQAIRTLSGFGTSKQMIAEIASIEPMVDSLLADPLSAKDLPFKTREEYEYFVQKMRLSISPDDSIVAHYIRNKADFANLKSNIEQETKNIAITEERGIRMDERWVQQYPQLLISNITFNNYELGNGLTFTIGGMIDNSVGYVYFNKEQAIPKMSPDRIIMLREIGDGWYIFKTT